MKKNLLFLSAIVLLASCQRSGQSILPADHDRQTMNCAGHEEQNSTTEALTGWGKHWWFVSASNVTLASPSNCYDPVTTDPVATKQISTADGPRYAKQVSDFFNSSDWEAVFPDLANEENRPDLEKLQSDDYFFSIEVGAASTTFFVARHLDHPSTIDFVLQADIVE
jgi:hypothetical protein